MCERGNFEVANLRVVVVQVLEMGPIEIVDDRSARVALKPDVVGRAPSAAHAVPKVRTAIREMIGDGI